MFGTCRKYADKGLNFTRRAKLSTCTEYTRFTVVASRAVDVLAGAVRVYATSCEHILSESMGVQTLCITSGVDIIFHETIGRANSTMTSATRIFHVPGSTPSPDPDVW